jgi:hypothetical protein
MIQAEGPISKYNRVGTYTGPALILLLLSAFPAPAAGQSTGNSAVPEDQFHVSVAFGGHFLVGVGYTHWVEEHHALEFTVFPFARPGQGFPFAVRGGYAWVPSKEIWRAKLGGNLAALFSPADSGADRITPILSFTPGIQYDPTTDSSLRTDLWVSYYLKQRVLAPSGIEFMYGWGANR